MLNQRWVNCASFKLVELDENGTMLTVIPRGRRASEEDTIYNIDVVNKRCDCAEWQDYGVPYIDAIAYFRFHKKVLLEQVLSEHVDQHYTCENESMLLRKKIVPVCMKRVCHDGTTLPPKASTKRSTGRLKKQRIRKRSRSAYDPENSNSVCSKCHQCGHNMRTCMVT
jgi:hypothetical protein